MKPWEEDWTADADRLELVSHAIEDARSSTEAKQGVVVGELGRLWSRDGEPVGLDVARASLAAAAPDLYRALTLLLEAADRIAEKSRDADLTRRCLLAAIALRKADGGNP